MAGRQAGRHPFEKFVRIINSELSSSSAPEDFFFLLKFPKFVLLCYHRIQFGKEYVFKQNLQKEDFPKKKKNEGKFLNKIRLSV